MAGVGLIVLDYFLLFYGFRCLVGILLIYLGMRQHYRDVDRSVNPDDGFSRIVIASPTLQPTANGSLRGESLPVDCEIQVEGFEMANDYEVFHAITGVLVSRGYDAHVEGGGAGCAWVEVAFPNGYIFMIGDVNDTWGINVYPNRQAVEDGFDPTCFETKVPRDIRDGQVIADAVQPYLTQIAALEPYETE